MFVNFKVNPQLILGTGYHYTRLTGAASAHYHLVNLAADYSGSKRTDVYAVAAFQKASGTTLDSHGAATAVQAVVGDYGVNAGSANQLLLAVGMMQRF